MSLINSLLQRNMEVMDTTNESYHRYLSSMICAWEPIIEYTIAQTVTANQSVESEDLELQGVTLSSDYVNTLLHGTVTHNENNREKARREFYARRECSQNNYTNEEVSHFPIEKICRGKNLTVLEKELLILLVALEIDDRFEKVYAFINDNVGRPFPTLKAITQLLDNLFVEEITLNNILESNLLKNFNITINSFDTASEHPILLGKLILQRDLATFLIFGDVIRSEELKSLAQYTEVSENAKVSQNSEIDNITRFAIENQHLSIAIDLRGKSQQYKQSCVNRLTTLLNKNCITINTPAFLEDESLIRKYFNQFQEIAQWSDSFLYFKNFEILDGNSNLQVKFLGALQNSAGILIFDSESEKNAWYKAHCDSYFKVESGILSYAELADLWAQELLPLGFGLDMAKELAVRFKFSEEQIQCIVTRYRNSLVTNTPQTEEEMKEILRHECSETSLVDLDHFAQKITPRYHWDDIVLHPHKKQQLEEIIHMIKYRDRVYEEWGYGEKLFSTVGVKALFYGEPGTGKTMSVDVLAKELGLEIFRIDLSQIVSKYVGETEKNLEKVFNEAAKTDAILFFDEADAIFGKRTEVKDAHDRHANIETGYLLQRIEEYDGLIILASNLKQNMDKAFLRRFQFIIHFDLPGENERKELWHKMFPTKVPVAPDVDFNFLSKGIKMSGAHIKNMAISAAFLAAHENSSIQMKHIIRSIRKEYAKVGKMVTRDELGAYLEMN